ncbi:MAG TPA: Pvc16 family protein [Vicinamibacterales bacterium]|nr:Pvc16 family protein [Vicinamibacterales bacterium]
MDVVMVNAINTGLAALLHDKGLIDAREIDVRFDVPTKDWVASLTRPTVSVFLFELQENTEKRDGTPQTTITGGRAERRMPPRRIDLRYMVSVLTAEVEDQHELLWRVMWTLMKYQELPSDVLPASLRTITPPLATRMAGDGENRNTIDVWTGLGLEPRPAMCYVVTAPMDLALAIEAPVVLTRIAKYHRIGSALPAPVDIGVQIGGVVKTRAGRPVPAARVVPDGQADGTLTREDGRYVLDGVPLGDMTVTVVRDGERVHTVKLRVPGDSYDIEVDT